MTDIMVKLRKCLFIAGAAATFVACTPQEVAKVISDYAAMRNAQDAEHVSEATTAAPETTIAAATETTVEQPIETTIAVVESTTPTTVVKPAQTTVHTFASGAVATITVDCVSMRTIMSAATPDRQFIVGYGGIPPIGFLADASGAFDRTILAGTSDHVVIVKTWMIAEGAEIISGSVDC